MQALDIRKFSIRIRIRNGGAVVENLHISGRDEAEAEAKLRQMYRHCEILEIHDVGCVGSRCGVTNFEDIVDLLSNP